MALGGKVYYAIDIVLLNQGEHSVKVTNVGTDESVVTALLHILEVGEVASVCKFVYVYNVIIWVLVCK